MTSAALRALVASAVLACGACTTMQSTPTAPAPAAAPSGPSPRPECATAHVTIYFTDEVQSTQPTAMPLLNDLTKHFATRTRAVAVVPYDPSLEVGSSIEYSDLLPETRQAWLRAASTMVEPFAE